MPSSRFALFLWKEARDATRRSGIEHAVIAQGDAFAGFRVWNKGGDLPGSGAADPGALLAFGIVVGGVKRVVLGDEQSAGRAEAAIFGEVFSVLVEDLD